MVHIIIINHYQQGLLLLTPATARVYNKTNIEMDIVEERKEIINISNCLALRFPLFVLTSCIVQCLL